MADGESPAVSLSEIDKFLTECKELTEEKTYTDLTNVDLNNICGINSAYVSDVTNCVDDSSTDDLISSQIQLSQDRHNEISEDISIQMQGNTTRFKTLLYTIIRSEYTQKPKDSFVSSLLSLTKKNINDLKSLRYHLYLSACQVPDFPYPNYTLKDRRKASNKINDSLQLKLAKDCFYLSKATQADFLPDLLDTFTASNKQKALTLLSENVNNSSQNSPDYSDSRDLKENLIRLERTVIKLRSEFVKDMDDFKLSLNAVKTDNSELKQQVEHLSYELRQSNEIISNLKSENEALLIKVNDCESSEQRVNTELSDMKTTVVNLCDDNIEVSKDLEKLNTLFLRLEKSSLNSNDKCSDLDQSSKDNSTQASQITTPLFQEDIVTSQPSHRIHDSTIKTYSDAAKTYPIETIISSNRSSTPGSNLVFKGKLNISRFYVGRITKDSTEAGIKDFLSRLNVKYTFVRFFNNPSRRFASAQVNVQNESCEIMNNANMWPDGIVIKPWLSWRKFSEQKQLRS
ncbi:hypothetical protein SNE40_018182 [Patella caerulea]|uniref:Uncharacterized protein n=1 Tax=Patella caerulea TaxID=87958 RepID=A0AAN8P6Q8_PATCE